MPQQTRPASDKPGVKTSEFWVTLAMVVIAAAVNAGLLPESTDLQGSASAIGTALAAMIAHWKYTDGRNQVKTFGQLPQPEETLRTIRELALTLVERDKQQSGKPAQ